MRRAYEQVAEQIRQWIVSGALSIGERLPTESELCEQFGTSRSTVREALRLLSSENLIVTQPGARGGSTVTRPAADQIATALKGSLALLVGNSDLSADEMLAARRLMEIPAAGLAAQNRTEGHLEALAALLPERIPDDVQAMFGINYAFHETLITATGNRLLPIVVLPIFEVSSSRVPRHRLESSVWTRVVDQHREIYEAVRDGDASAASAAMDRHLCDLGDAYESVDHER